MAQGMRCVVRARFVCVVVVLLFELSPNRTVQAAGASRGKQSTPEHNLAIIVNRSNPVENLSFIELRKIFLGERSHWPNGRRIAVAMMDSARPERRTILREVYRMTEGDYRDHFLKGVYAGDVFVAPKTLSSPAVVGKFVFNALGAIGYLRASDVDGSVKVVRIDGRLPNDLDYRLQLDEGLGE